MKIIKPYGQTRVEPNATQAPRQRHFYKAAQTTPTPLTHTLTQNTDALIAVWVSTIDKVFGKPYELKDIDCKRKDYETDEEYQTALKKRQDNYARKQSMDKLRTDVINAAYTQLEKRLKAQGHSDDALNDAENKWKHKLTLSTSLACSKPIGCKPGKLYDWFVHQAPSDLTQVATVVERIEKHIHSAEIQTAIYKDKQVIDVHHKTHGGLIANRAYSVMENTPNKKLAEEQFASQTFNNTTQTFYTTNGTQDPIATIWQHAKKLEKADKNRNNLKCIKRKDLTSTIGQTLREHSHRIFPEKTIKAIVEKYPEAFALHQAIKAYYKKLLDRNTLQLMHLPKNLDEILSKIKQTQNNQDINALIRLGKVLHYSWMDKTTGNLSLDALASVNVDKSPYWTSLGQFKIKNDEAFLRIWRHSLSLANAAFAYWADPEHQRNKADIVVNETFHDVMEKHAHPQHWQEHARMLLGNTGHSLDQVATMSEVLRYTRNQLQQLRNQSFHFKGIPTFMGAHKSPNTEQLDATQVTAVQQLIDAFYQHELEQRREHWVSIMRGLKVGQHFTAQQWRTLAPLLNHVEDYIAIVLPNLSKVWRRANEVDKHTTPSEQYQPYFTEYPKFNALEAQANATPAEQTTLWEWERCRYDLLKWIYDNRFAQWLHSKGQSKEFNNWLKGVCNATTERAKKRNDASMIKITAKAQKILDRHDGRPISYVEFFQDLTSEVQKISSNEIGQQDKTQQSQAKAIEHFRLDFYAWAFAKYAICAEAKAALALLGEPVAPAKTNAQAQQQNSDPITEELLKETAPAWIEAQITEAEKRERADLYYLLHLMPADAISLLLHQFKKWHVLHKAWKIEVYAHGRAADFGLPEAAPDPKAPLPPSPLEPFVTRWVSVMQHYLLSHQAKYSGGSNQPNDLDWLATLYEKPEHVQRIFTQTDAITLIPRRHLREMRRFGYPQIHKKLTACPINHNTVEDYFASQTPEQQAEIATHHQTLQSLHAQWVEQKRRFNQHTDYQTRLSKIEVYKHRKSTVLLLDEYKRYQLLMKVLGRLVDYAGLWERDAIFLITACLYYLRQENTQYPEPQNFHSNMTEGQWKNVWKSIHNNVAQSTSITLKHLNHAIDRMGLNTQTTKDLRNNFAHFNMLGKKAPAVNLIRLIEDTRTLMAYDRKLKNAVSCSIVDMFERDGLILKLTFNNHRISTAQISSREIVHLKDETHKNGEAITEDHHSAHYVNLMAALFG